MCGQNNYVTNKSNPTIRNSTIFDDRF